jgi:glycine hydroxymethyltransferase
MHVIAAKAVAFEEALQPAFEVYARQVIKNAQALAQTLVDLGYNLVSGGTDNHLMLVDLRNRKLTGKDAQEALEEAGITTNKNAVPFDDQSPLVTSGIRIGTPALTTRGMKEAEMRTIGGWIHEVLSDVKNTSKKREVRESVRALCKKFRLYL